jgi:hypothetical protein
VYRQPITIGGVNRVTLAGLGWWTGKAQASEDGLGVAGPQ